MTVARESIFSNEEAYCRFCSSFRLLNISSLKSPFFTRLISSQTIFSAELYDWINNFGIIATAKIPASFMLSLMARAPINLCSTISLSR